MRVLYLHIGMPKTGTSALQTFLAKNREHLYEDGIWYPELDDFSKVKVNSKRIGGNAAVLLTCFAMGYKATQSFWDTCKKLWDGADDRDILLSKEMSFEAAKAACKNFMAYGFDVRVIVYLRRQDLWGESVWNQEVKSGSVSRNCLEHMQRFELDYYKALKEIATIVGKDSVIVSVYESKGRKGEKTEDIFTTFLNILGIYDTEKYQKDAWQVNPSLSANYVEIKRIFNSIPMGFTFVKSIKGIIEGGRKYALANEEIVHAPSFLSREERLAILEKYHESNTMLAKEFLGRDTLFDETIGGVMINMASTMRPCMKIS